MRRLARLQFRISNLFKCGRNAPRTDIQFLLRELRECRFGQVQIPCQNVAGCARYPVRNAEGPEFREVPVVESEQEVALAGTKGLDCVPVASREVPGVAFLEIVHFGLAVWSNDRGAAPSCNHVSPLSGQCVPVELANRARL